MESPFDWLKVGHWTDPDARTGCTVVVFDQLTTASGEVRGGAPATREFALLEPGRFVERVDAVVLTGGSAFGLSACDGVVGELEHRGMGHQTRSAIVPIVCGMALYDLGVGDPYTRPNATHGRTALQAADATFDVGAVGAGTGATTGKIHSDREPQPGGVGAAIVTSGPLTFFALIAVNAFGDFASTSGAQATMARIESGSFTWPSNELDPGENTTIGLIATNAYLDKADCRRIAEAGHDGMARALYPSHTFADGDALIAVANPLVETDLGTCQTLAAAAVEQAIGSLT